MASRPYCIVIPTLTTFLMRVILPRAVPSTGIIAVSGEFQLAGGLFRRGFSARILVLALGRAEPVFDRASTRRLGRGQTARRETGSRSRGLRRMVVARHIGGSDT